MFVDTNILIDVIRRHRPALEWMEIHYHSITITPIVWMEVMKGAASKETQREIIELLNPLRLEHMIPDDFYWAMDKQTKFHLSFGLDMNDCLIASVAHRLQVPLFTHNLKHFRPILGELAQSPY